MDASWILQSHLAVFVAACAGTDPSTGGIAHHDAEGGPTTSGGTSSGGSGNGATTGVATGATALTTQPGAAAARRESQTVGPARAEPQPEGAHRPVAFKAAVPRGGAYPADAAIDHASADAAPSDDARDSATTACSTFGDGYTDCPTEWVRQFGGPNDDGARSVAVDGGGNI